MPITTTWMPRRWIMTIELKILRSDGDYKDAMAEIGRLWGAKKGTPEGDRLDLLAMLVERYEAELYPVGRVDPIDAIKFRMEQQGLDRKALERLIGSRNRVSEVLNRKRPLSIEMIRRLHREFSISADVLIRPVRLSSTRALAVSAKTKKTDAKRKGRTTSGPPGRRVSARQSPRHA